MRVIGEVEEDEDSVSEEEDEDDLASFRQEWRRELERPSVSPGRSQEEPEKRCDEEPEDEEDDDHQRARSLFLQGAQYEERGKLYEAIKCYRRAEKLVPNIEFKTFDYTGRNKRTPPKEDKETDHGYVEKAGVVEEEEDQEDILNLVQRFSRMRSTSESTFIQPEVETGDCHIGELPSEIINYILKWVVSSELDLRSLESCSAVSRGFYMAARDEDIWRLACIKVWGSSASTSNLFPGWRELFLARPRVNYNGCYVSKISYIREGERGFQDQETFRAWHVVEYHRFLRFFPGGQVAMLTSANDDPALVAKQMNTKPGCILLGAMMGHYKIVDNTLVCVLKKAVERKKNVMPTRFRGRKRKDVPIQYHVPDQDFHLEFQIRGSKWKILQWVKYIILSKYSNERVQEDKFDISNGRNYPKLQFARVGSYHFESNSHL